MKRISLACGLFLISATNSLAAVVYDSNGFEAYNPGILVGQTGGGATAWTDFNPTTGNRFLVQSAVTNGGNRAVSVTSTNAIAAFVAPALNYTPTGGEIVVIEVDIARTISGTPALPTSNGFAIDVYDPAGNRTIGFGLGVNANNSAIVPFLTVFATGNAEGADVPINLAVAQNQFVRFRAELNYATDRFQLFVNDANVGGIHQFVNLASALGDADLQHDSVSGAADIGYFDNYRISTVPEPSSTIGCIALSLSFLRRRRQV